MPLIETIENLRSKPETERKKVLIFAVLLIMTIIVAIWVSTLNFTFTNQDSVVEDRESDLYTPLTTIKDTVAAMIKSINNHEEKR
ncbi:MAG TPA: hypothetical protein VJJ73_02210 [Candidatus Paceibacterota bacterium]